METILVLAVLAPTAAATIAEQSAGGSSSFPPTTADGTGTDSTSADQQSPTRAERAATPTSPATRTDGPGQPGFGLVGGLLGLEEPGCSGSVADGGPPTNRGREP